jgi:hypothetical protein
MRNGEKLNSGSSVPSKSSRSHCEQIVPARCGFELPRTAITASGYLRELGILRKLDYLETVHIGATHEMY